LERPEAQQRGMGKSPQFLFVHLLLKVIKFCFNARVVEVFKSGAKRLADDRTRLRMASRLLA